VEGREALQRGGNEMEGSEKWVLEVLHTLDTKLPFHWRARRRFATYEEVQEESAKFGKKVGTLWSRAQKRYVEGVGYTDEILYWVAEVSADLTKSEKNQLNETGYKRLLKFVELADFELQTGHQRYSDLEEALEAVRTQAAPKR